MLQRGGKPIAVILPAEDLGLIEKLLEEEEDRLDLEDALAAEADAEAKDEKFIPREEAKRSLNC